MINLDGLYISDKLNNNKIIRNIKSKKKFRGYALLLAKDDKHIFQIIRCRRIDYEDQTLILIGIFKEKHEAYLYVKNIFQDAIDKEINLSEIKNYYSKVG